VNRACRQPNNRKYDVELRRLATPPRRCAQSPPESGAVQVEVVDADVPADDAATIDADFITAFYALEKARDDTGFFVVLVVTGVRAPCY
jgi:hypothetical protein